MKAALKRSGAAMDVASEDEREAAARAGPFRSVPAEEAIADEG